MRIFGLADCNNFYASCERIFRPDLRGRPIIVLSNNDGCVVARSAEAKTLGIKMGTPFFQLTDLVKEHGIVPFSSNYALYADVSSRVMSILDELSPRVENYSIDESFIDATGINGPGSLEAYGHQLRDTVKRWTGIDICVGFSTSKTLAKAANHAAKRYRATGGVVDLTDPIRQRRLLALCPVGDVWGIGRRLAKRLEEMGIKTALDLADANPRLIRQEFSVVVERTVRELNGVSCIDLEEVAPAKQQIISSRSFGQRITDKWQMLGAISDYTAKASEKLRSQNQHARGLTVFVRTNLFNLDEPRYSNQATGALSVPSSDTRQLQALASKLLDGIWKDGYRYAKAGVMLSDFYDQGVYQTELFDEQPASTNSQALMSVIDQVNAMGKGRLFFARQGVNKEWEMKRQHLSPAYTTRWSDLPKVR